MMDVVESLVESRQMQQSMRPVEKQVFKQVKKYKLTQEGLPRGKRSDLEVAEQEQSVSAETDR